MSDKQDGLMSRGVMDGERITFNFQVVLKPRFLADSSVEVLGECDLFPDREFIGTDIDDVKGQITNAVRDGVMYELKQAAIDEVQADA